jgi:uracil-DNA glycosylase family 4
MMDPEFSKLKQKIRECTECGLAKTRKHAVCGEGNAQSKVMMIAQAPGEFEDKTGRMFVGPSGMIFHKLLTNAGIKIDEIYMTNLIKCYIPRCRRPSKDEIEQCSKYLEQEINHVKPKVIVPLGFHATRYIMKRFELKRPISKEYHNLFARSIEVDEYLIFPLRHPTALLFNSGKRDLMEKNYAKIRSILDNLRGN